MTLRSARIRTAASPSLSWQRTSIRSATRSVALDADDTLAGRRQHPLRRQCLGDLRRQPQPLQSGRGEYDCIELAAVAFIEPRLHVAAQRANIEVRPGEQQLCLPAKARRTDNGAGTETVERRPDQCIARVLARKHRRECEALGRFGRDVFHRMHGEIGGAVEQRALELLDETAPCRRFSPVSWRGSGRPR